MINETLFKSAGEAQRGASAATALVEHLRDDPRVQRAFEAWCVAHELSRDLNAVQFRAALLRDKERNLAALLRLVRDELQLLYAWLPRLLLIDFAARAISPQMGRLILEAPSQTDLESIGIGAGRAPKGGGEYIWRDVAWFYRVKVKSPQDSVRGIAAEHASAAGRDNDARSVVQTAVGRIAELLSAFEDSPI